MSAIPASACARRRRAALTVPFPPVSGAKIHAFPSLRRPNPDSPEVGPVGGRRLLALPARGVIYDVGAAASEIYEVASGWVSISKALRDNRRTILDVAGAGQMFGFCAGALHDCKAVTSAKTTLRVYDSRCLLEHPAEARRAFDSLMGQMERLKRVKLWRSAKASERVAAFLVTLLPHDALDRVNVALPLSRTDLADYLELTAETVSRAIAQLRKAEILEIDQTRSGRVLDVGCLRQIASGAVDIKTLKLGVALQDERVARHL